MTQSTVADQHAVIGIPGAKASIPASFTSNPHPEAAWFRKINFGVFIHWGISSVRAEVDLSWGMVSGTAYDLGAKITPRHYFAQAESFHPEFYNPEKWLRAAAAAGANHAVLTTKHHDGFALWPSRFGDFNTKNFLGGRDLVKEFVEACAKTGIRPGLYYSPPDWYYNRHRMSFRRASSGTAQNPHLGLDHEPIDIPAFDPTWEKKFHAYLRGQIEELLTNYGRIDLLFFDGRPEVISIDRIRELQPSILVNERMHGYGDFATPECQIPAAAPDGPWEVVDTWDMAGRWGYAMPFVNRPASWVADRLCQTGALGGNYMINIAPRADGALPESILNDLEWLSDWRKTAKTAFRDVQALPSSIRSNVPARIRENELFLFPPNPFYSLMQITGVPAPQSVTLVSSQESIPYGHIPHFSEGPRLNILLPPKVRSGGDIIRIQFEKSIS